MSNRITFENVRLAFDPEIRYTSAGKAVCEVKFADQQRKKNQAGEWEDASDALWVTASVWDADGEALAEAVHKGDKVTVTGTLVARNYDRKDGGKGTSLEVRYATVAKVPTAPKADRGSFGGQQQADPWTSGGGAKSSPEPAWGGQSNQPAPF
jgi:single-strand DNA-binding protein